MLNLEELKIVRDTDLSNIRNYVTEQHFQWLTAKNDHYTLLAFLSSKINNSVIYDIGTYRGMSAIALSVNKTNKIVSYDIANFLEIAVPPNIEFKIGNCYDDPDMANSPLILLDVDPHDGIFEPQFVSWLKENNFKGWLLLDDIHLNPAMEKFWNDIDLEKYDLTDVGHYSGTGLVVFK